MNRLLSLLLFVVAALAQDSLRAPRLVLDFPLADCPYHTYAARHGAAPALLCESQLDHQNCHRPSIFFKPPRDPMA